MPRIASLLMILFIATALIACAAPTTSPATGNLAGTDAPAPAAPPPAPSLPPPPHGSAKAPPPMSEPYPPREVPQTVALDYGCKTSADCAVKNVGNCCGAMPACVNKDSPTDPAAVQAQCQAKGMMSVCGFQEISSCQCVSGKCASADAPRAQ